MLNQTNEQKFEPPQSLHVPGQKLSFQDQVNLGMINAPVLLTSHDDAKEFHAGLEQTRAWLKTRGEEHFLKDKTLNALGHEKCKLIGIRNNEGELVSGALIVGPITRELATEFSRYSFGIEGGPASVVLGSMWTNPDYMKRGFVTACVHKAMEVAKDPLTFPKRNESSPSVQFLVAGVADGNPNKIVLDKIGFKFIGSGYHAEKDHPMSYMRLML